MAKQNGAFPLEGTIGDMVFYKTKYGYMVRTKGSLTKERIATEENFERTRETYTEYGYASRVGKLLRHGVKGCCPDAEQGETNYKLAPALTKIVRQDAKGERGKRRLTAETIGQIEGFDWNNKARLRELLHAPIAVTANAGTGKVTCTISSFLPGRDMRLPPGATHVELTLVVVVADYDTDAQKRTHDKSGPLPLTGGTEGNLTLSCTLPAAKGQILMAGIGVQAYQEVNRELYPLTEGCGFGIVKAMMGS